MLIDRIPHATWTVSQKRLDKTGEYDISFYQKYIKENTIILAELITDVEKIIEQIENEELKKDITIQTKNKLYNLYNIFKEYDVQEVCTKDEEGFGYFSEHPYARSIEIEFEKISKSLYLLIEYRIYMLDLWFKTFFTTEGFNDGRKINIILFEVQCSGKLLGIFGINDEKLEEMIKYNQDALEALVGKEILETKIIEKAEKNIDINCIPFFVKVPQFTSEGAKEKTTCINDKIVITYPQSYLNVLNEESKMVL